MASDTDRQLWLCLHLPRLGLEIVTRSLADGAADRPVVLVDAREVVQVNGTGLARGLRPGMSLSTAESICADLAIAFRDAAREAATLERLAAAGLKIGIATNDAEVPARRDMEHIGVADLCDVIYGHDSHGAKPGPEMMAAFCAETGLRPDQVAMVGDTMTDLRFARNAGAHCCIGIIDPSYANQPFVEGVDLQVEHVDAIPALLGL